MLQLNPGRKTPRLCFTALTLLLSGQTYALNCANENPAIMATTPSSDFLLHGDGTVTHSATGLMWMQCSLGQSWNSGDCSGDAATYSWKSALQAAVTHEFSGYSDWRLPNKNELASIVEERCWRPSINLAVFPSTPSTFPTRFWSSSPVSIDDDNAWIVDFEFGDVDRLTGKIRDLRVRLVRTGQ